MTRAYTTIEFPSTGTTYSREEYGVYRYDTFPSGSVLAGQERRSWLDAFETLAEAQATFPDAEWRPNFCGQRAPDLSHLPFDPDYD